MRSLEGTRSRLGPGAVSPELVLVDLDLAREARSCLPNPDDTLARVALLVRASRIAADRACAVAASPPILKASPRPQAATRLRNGRTAMLTGGAVAAALVGALLVGVRVNVRGTPAGADTAAIGEPPVAVGQPLQTRTAPPRSSRAAAANTAGSSPAAAANTAAPHRPRATKPPARVDPNPGPRKVRAARRFVWAPVAGASGYRVEFFKGSALVFSAETSHPEVTIPTSWMLHGKRQSLRTGEYQWYVWPLRGGLRAPSAIVQARLSVRTG